MKFKNQRGAVFITTMVCTLLMLMVGESLYQLTAHEFIFTKHLDNSLEAHSLAEAGLAKALSTLNTDFDSKDNAGNFPSTSLDGGTYDASVATVSSRNLVSSVGVYRNIQRSVSAEVIAPILSALDYALAAGGNITWDPGSGSSNGTVTGDIYGSGNVNLDGTINGDVTAGGNISGGAISGTQTPNSGTVVGFPVVNSSFYQTIAQANGQYFSSDKSYTSASPMPASPDGGVIFVNGNLSITGDQAITACIFATGNITIAKAGSDTPNVTINQYSNYPAMVALGNIAISSTGNSQGGASFTATGLIYAGGNFDISGNHYDNPRVDITGSIIARGNITTNLTAQNSLLMTFEQQSPPGFTLPNSSMSIVSYNT